MKALRWLVGRLVLLVNWLTMPRAGQRDAAHQAQVEKTLKGHALYLFPGCPFCVKVMRAARRLNLPLEMRDASRAGEHRQALLEQGGRLKAPCLRIDSGDGRSQWMYESADIIAYLQRQFPLEAEPVELAKAG